MKLTPYLIVFTIILFILTIVFSGLKEALFVWIIVLLSKLKF